MLIYKILAFISIIFFIAAVLYELYKLHVILNNPEVSISNKVIAYLTTIVWVTLYIYASISITNSLEEKSYEMTHPDKIKVHYVE